MPMVIQHRKGSDNNVFIRHKESLKIEYRHCCTLNDSVAIINLYTGASVYESCLQGLPCLEVGFFAFCSP